MAADLHRVHGSAVAVDGRGALIIGASGAGKSSLALEMIALGADLVADDQVEVIARSNRRLTMTAPATLAGLIEARGLGLLQLPFVTARLSVVVDLDVTETDRLPETHETVMAGEVVPVLRKVESPVFAAMLMAYLIGGRREA